MNLYQQYISKSKYARYIDELQRREHWPETVKRYFDFVQEHLEEKQDYFLSKELREELETAVLNLEVMPSMRLMMTAGEAAKRQNLCSYNCSSLAIDDPKAFDELLYVLMCGAGVGFSVERQFVNKLNDVPDKLYDSDTTVVVSDSKEGWAKGLRQIIAILYSGEIPKWDLHKVRPAGSRLRIFGGRSSGPEPLNQLFRFVVKIFKQSEGRKLTSLECHDLCCKIAEVVVVGGSRRAALISLSNLSDDRLRKAKAGNWWEANAQRSLSNNSAVYTEKPEVGSFMQEWLSLYESKSGERGFFNRKAADKQAERTGRRKPYAKGFLCNPCGEIILRDAQVCNLTEVVVRPSDTEEDLFRKIKLAAILGTFQSSLTNFPYVRKQWRQNAEEERLLGVSLTGICDNKLLNNPEDRELPDRLKQLKVIAIDTNKKFAEHLGIQQSASVTTTKPSGTVSQLVNCSSGIHPAHAAYYIRTVRNDNKDPLTQLLKDSGIPWEPCVSRPDATTVFSFPIKSSATAVLRSDMSALSHLRLWMIYKQNYTEHNPSITISVKETEWPAVGGAVWDNFDEILGVSFLPFNDDDHSYKQAPYQEITKEKYEELNALMPKEIDWDSLVEYEDVTEGVQNLACTGGFCEI